MNQNRPDAKKNATQAQQQAYEELRQKKLKEQFDVSDADSMSSFWFLSNEKIRSLEDAIYVEMERLQRIRESYIISQEISEQEVAKDSFDASFYSTTEGEKKVYNLLPISDLFNVFKNDLFLQHGTMVKSTSFSDYARDYCGLNLEIGNLDFAKTNEGISQLYVINNARMNASLAIQYYLDSLGNHSVQGLKKLKQLNVSEIRNIIRTHFLLYPEKSESVVNELAGMSYGYSYILGTIQSSPRWVNICEFKKQTTTGEEQKSWNNYTPPFNGMNKEDFVAALRNELVSEFPEGVKFEEICEVAYTIYVNQNYLNGCFEAVEDYQRSLCNHPQLEGLRERVVTNNTIPYYKTNHIHTGINVLNHAEVITHNLDSYGQSLKNSQSDVFLATRGCQATLNTVSFIYLGAIAGIPGFVISGVAAYAIEVVREHINTKINEGKIEDAKVILNQLNAYLNERKNEINKRLFRTTIAGKESLIYMKEKLERLGNAALTDNQRMLRDYLIREIDNPQDNYFVSQNELLQKVNTNEEGPLSEELKKIEQQYVEIDQKLQEISVYSYCADVYAQSRLVRTQGLDSHQIFLSDNPTEESGKSVVQPKTSNIGSFKFSEINTEDQYVKRSNEVLDGLIEDWHYYDNDLRYEYNQLRQNTEGDKPSVEKYLYTYQMELDYRNAIMRGFLGIDENSTVVRKSDVSDGLLSSLLGAVYRKKNKEDGECEYFIAGNKIDYSSLNRIFQFGVGATSSEDFGELDAYRKKTDQVISKYYDVEKMRYDFLKSLQAYALSDYGYLMRASVVSQWTDLFPNRKERLKQAKSVKFSEDFIAKRFKIESSILMDMETVLKTAPDFEIICQKNGWIDKDGKPDLNKIAPIPNDGKSVEKAMAHADALEKRVLSLIKALDLHRREVLKEKERYEQQKKETLSTQMGDGVFIDTYTVVKDSENGEDGLDIVQDSDFVELSSETKGKIDDYLSKYHNNDVNSPYLGEYAIVKFANNSRNDPEYLATIQYLIAKGADINATDKYTGRSVLGFMYRHLSPEQLDYFFNENANIDLSVREKDGSTVFYTAFDSHFKSDDKLNVLFERVKDNPEQLSLMLEGALRHGDLEWANNLIEAGADLKSSMPQLLVSAASCSLDIKPLTFLLEHGATIEDFNKALNILNTYDLSPRDKEDAMEHLISVASIEIPETMRISNAIEDKKHYYENLPTDPAVINQKDKYGNTLLMQAVQRADIRAIQHYLTHGADVTLTNNAGKTALAIAKDGLNEETPSPNRDYSYCAKLLIGDGAADKETEESRNLNALIEAVYSGDTAGVKKISAQMPRLNIQTPEGEDVYSAWAKRIIVLINNAENPADIEKISHMDIEDMTQVKGLNKERALLILSHGLTLFPEENGRDTKARELLSQLAIKLVDKMHSIDINCVDEWGNTPLHYACASGDKKLAETLLNKHAFVNVKNALGQTPVEYAAMLGRRKTISDDILRGLSYSQTKGYMFSDKELQHTGVVVDAKTAVPEYLRQDVDVCATLNKNATQIGCDSPFKIKEQER